MSTTDDSLTTAGTDLDSVRRRVDHFLAVEADLLDRWRLHEWLDLFDPGAHYLVPSTDKPEGNPDEDLFLVQDDLFLLTQRVNSLMKRSAHAEYPRSRTRRLISGILTNTDVDGLIRVQANFAVYRIRNGVFDTFVGQYRHVLAAEGETFRFRERKAVLDLDALRPQGKVSIIL